MRSHYKIINQDGIFFITSTIVEWIPVFTSEKYFKIIIDSMKHCRNEKNLKIYSYMILDNHFHMIVSGENLTETIGSLKGFTASEIIKQLRVDKKDWLLNQLKYYKLKHKVKSSYQIWQESFHPQEIVSDEMFQQKLDYIHFNPVKRGLVMKPEDWRYSSASYYILGKEGEIKIDNYYI